MQAWIRPGSPHRAIMSGGRRLPDLTLKWLGQSPGAMTAYLSKARASRATAGAMI